MIFYKTAKEIELMRESAQIVSRTLGMIAETIKEGITLNELDRLAEEFIRDNGGVPSFKGFGGFPASLCLSPNETVVHGIPDDRPVRNGDILSVDCGVFKNGFHGDHAYTFMIGDVAPPVRDLVRVTRESLDLAIAQVASGKRIGDVSFAVQRHAQKHGFSVPRELTGHGLGKDLHEEPVVANYGRRGSGPLIKEGLVIAIEPMVNMGRQNIVQLPDNWTINTVDKKPSAHFEHDVAFINGKADVLSTFDFVDAALAKRDGIE